MIGDSTKTINGRATIHPDAPVPSGSEGQWTIRYVAGPEGVGLGGGVRVIVQRYWTEPQTEHPDEIGFVMACCDKPGVKLDVRIADRLAEGGRFGTWYRRAGMPINARLMAKWGGIFVDVVEGQLVEGDVVEVSYLGAAPTVAGVAYPFTVATDPDGSRSAPYTGYAFIDRSPELLVVANAVQRIEAFVPSTTEDVLASDQVRAVGRDRFANPCALPAVAQIWIQDHRSRVRVGELTATSNYSQVRKAGGLGLYWGDLHVHSWRSDGVGSLQDIYAYARDVLGLDFVGHGDHTQYMSDGDWDDIKSLTRRMNHPGRFISFPGFELSHNPRRLMPDGSFQQIVPWYGDKNVYYFSEDDAPILRVSDRYRSYHARFLQIAEQLRGRKAMIVPHLHAGGLMTYYDPELVWIIEAFSAHHFDIDHRDFEAFEGMWQEYLAAGCRVGLVGGSDNHNARAGQDTYFPWQTHRRRGALMAVWAPELTREALWEAIRSRCVYATTGARIYLDVQLNGHRMGEEFSVPDALVPKEIEIEVHSTAPIEALDVLRSNDVVRSFTPNTWDFEATFVDREYSTGEDFYQVRVVQKDMHRAWSTPVWVDLAPQARVGFPGQEATWRT